MSVITKGKTFANGEQLTAGKLNQMLDAAVFSSAAVDNTKTTLSGGAITIAPSAITATEVAQSFLDTIYPVGSVYINATDGRNPGTLLGFGTWAAFGAGRVPVGIDSTDNDFDAVGIGNNTNSTTGAKTHTLSIAEMPAHDHVDNRNEFDSNNILLRRSSSGTGSPNGSDSSVGEVQVIGAGAYDDPFPRIEGSGSAHNNLQPYIVVYMWKRTA
tara:strand:+ start:11 stop:652 length:642 start_codon:yes stop_codon:yes gene_type:complete